MISPNKHSSTCTYSNVFWRIITHYVEEISASEVESLIQKIIPEASEKAKKEFYECINELSGRFGKYE